MKKLKLFLVMVLLMSISIVFIGCSQASRVSSNLSKQADAFNVVRQLTVINCFSDDVILQMTGRISIKKDVTENQLEIIIEYAADQYMKDFVGLSDNVTYTVVQVEPIETDPYKYTLNYNPKMWMPIAFDTIE